MSGGTNIDQRTAAPGHPLRLREFLPYRLSVVSERISRLFAERYEREFGLSIPEWRVIAILGEHTSLGTQDVIEATGMDRVRVSRAVIRLADKGLLTRKAPAGDKRAQLLRLSRRGVSIYAKVVPLAQDLQRELAAKLGSEEMQVLGRILAKLHESADELGGRQSHFSD